MVIIGLIKKIKKMRKNTMLIIQEAIMADNHKNFQEIVSCH